MKFELFDCNVQIGRCGNPIPEYKMAAGDIVNHLRPMNINRALAYHAIAKELHPAEGNPTLLEESADLPLYPCWVAMPHHTGEFPEPSELVCQMKLHNVRAVRLFPALHNYSLDEWCAGELLTELEANRIPVLIESSQISMDKAASTLSNHPGLRLILLQPNYRSDRLIYPLLEKYENFMIETSYYVVCGGIEAICSKFGASHLVFGTGYPVYEPGAAISYITQADVSDEEKQMIACGNLERLLSWS